MISYKPLFHTLIEKELSREQFRLAINAGKTTVSKIFTGKHVSLDVIERICLVLNVPISSVLEILPDDPPAKGKDAEK